MSGNDKNKTEEKGFTVTDKRRNSTSKEEVESNFRAKTDDIKHTQQSASSQTQESAEEEVTFSGLIFSLSHSAMVQLGEIPDPMTQQTQKNLPVAKQTIDILSILQEKTKGNLAKEEELLLENILYDLRMRFVQSSS